jgi:hypothetical protein
MGDLHVAVFPRSAPQQLGTEHLLAVAVVAGVDGHAGLDDVFDAIQRRGSSAPVLAFWARNPA